MRADLPRLTFDRNERDAAVALMIPAEALFGCRGRALVLLQADGAVRPGRNRRRMAMKINPDEQDRDDHEGCYQPAEDRVAMGRTADHARRVEGGPELVKKKAGPTREVTAGALDGVQPG
jgi:hypothetical protein